MFAAAVLVFVVLGMVQSAVAPRPAAGVVTAPIRAAIRDPFLNLSDLPPASRIADNLRDFVAAAISAPPTRVTVVRTNEGAMQMLQYGGHRVTALVGLAGLLAVFVGAIAGSTRAALRRPEVALAVGVLAFNIIFHLFYRANGQPVIFTAHTVAAVLVVLAAAYAGGSGAWRLPVIAGGALAIAANNGAFIGEVRRALDAPCAELVGAVCVRWANAADQASYSEGVAQFVASADYPFEHGRSLLGRSAFAEAVPPLERAIAMDPAHDLAAQYLGFALLRSGRAAESVPWLERAVARQPRDPVLGALLNEARGRSR
jgi:hypothetical protein